MFRQIGRPALQKQQMAATSRRRPPRDPPIERTPSSLWDSLPVKLRMLLLLVGFLLSYYIMFGRHQKSDRRAKQMKEIHKDLEDIIRKASESGFMSQNLVEAVLPEIFREGEEKNSSRSETKPGQETKAEDSGSESDEALPERLEGNRKTTKKQSDKTSKPNDNPSLKTASNGKPRDPKKATSKSANAQMKKKSKKRKKKRKKRKTGGKRGSAEAKTESISTGSDPKPNVSDDDSGSGNVSSSPAIHEATTSPTKSQMSDVTETVNEGEKEANSTLATGSEPESRKTSTDVSSVKAESNKTATSASTTSEDLPQSNVTNSGNPEAVKPLVNGPRPAEDDASSSVIEPSRKTEASANVHRKTSSTQKGLPPQFEGLVDMQVSQDSIPILNWHPEAIMNESTTEQIFGLGDRHDHIVAYKPLCLNTESEEGIVFQGNTVCGGFNRTEGWMRQYCNVMKSATRKEYLLKVQHESESKEWLEKNAKSIHWVHGLTALQVLERNCGNIAHFAGRALLLQHIIENVGSYAAPPNDPFNILILPTFHVMKRFLYPQNYAHWHERFLGAVVAPGDMKIGDLGNFLYRSSKRRQPNEPLVQLLHNFSIAKSTFAEKKYVCFKRVVIPGYLKGRFFVNDVDYPSHQPSLQSEDEHGPSIPRDSLRMRERISALVDQTSEFRTMEKEVILIDRQGKRRIFDEAKKPGIVKVFEGVASKHGYKFKVVSFENMTFDEQYRAVSTAAVAIGIHGANLVNTMFMPPLAVLIELFPYGFVHEMYRNGGNAGLKYFSYQMSTGIPFKGKNVYRSPEQCVKLNKDCKVHYRDSILQVTDGDVASMGKILADAIAWCDKLPRSSKQTAEPARKRRRLLRQLIERALGRGRGRGGLT